VTLRSREYDSTIHYIATLSIAPKVFNSYTGHVYIHFKQ
jgi:hypothetical protein